MSYYAVHKGFIPGIFLTYQHCKKSIYKFDNPIYKKFENINDAITFVENGNEEKEKKISINEDTMYIYTDGACSKNGKEDARSGIGIYFGDDDERNVSEELKVKYHTNNVAELSAIILACKIAENELKDEKKVMIITDSRYCVLCCTSYGKKNDDINWKKFIPNRPFVKEVYSYFKKYSNLDIKYVKAHTNNTDVHSLGNKYADTFAQNSIN